MKERIIDLLTETTTLTIMELNDKFPTVEMLQVLKMQVFAPNYNFLLLNNLSLLRSQFHNKFELALLIQLDDELNPNGGVSLVEFF